MVRFGFTKQKRLLKARDFQRVFDRSSAKVSSRVMLLIAAPNDLSQPRIGFIIAKKQVRLAVKRNRIKRVIRETFRHLDSEDFSYDVILLARKGVDQQSNRKIRSEFEHLWQKLKKRANSEGS